MAAALNCRSRLARPADAESAARVARARCVITVGAGASGLGLAASGLEGASSCDDSWLPLLCSAESITLAASGLLSCWCLGAAAHALYARGGLLPRRAARSALPALLLLRALLCGLLVAILGWLHLHRGQRHLLLMGAMQTSAMVAAWAACAAASTVRSKSPTPPSGDLEGGGGDACGGGADGSSGAPGATPSTVKRTGSLTLPRGWRYHKSSGMFEHKRSGRMQWEPPSVAETGSPLHADLPPCDEERGWHSACEGRGGEPKSSHSNGSAHGGSGYRSTGTASSGSRRSDYDSDSGSDSGDKHKGRGRRSLSSTWAYRPRASESGGHKRGGGEGYYHGGAPPPSGGGGSGERRSSSGSRTPMSVWELREALGEKGGPDAARRRSGYGSGGGGQHSERGGYGSGDGRAASSYYDYERDYHDYENAPPPSLRSSKGRRSG